MTKVINLAGGKYTVEIEDSTGRIRALRYGEPWRERDLYGDNLIYNLATELFDAREEISRLMDEDL